MAEYILAYDLGSTGLKAAIFNPVGRVIASRYVPTKTYYLLPTWIEQSPEEWWKAVCKSTRSLLEETNISPEQIKAIAPVGHQIGAIPVDRTGRLLREHILLWSDGRSSKQAAELIQRVGGYDSFYKIHGLGHPPEILSICKAMWLKENEPELYNKTFKFLQAKDFIILNLTDRKVFVDDYGDASNTGWFDIVNRCYSKELIEAASLDLEKLPELCHSHEIVGHVGKEASELTGLKQDTPIVAGSGDVPAACLGAGLIREKMCYVNVGTANWNGAYVAKPCLDSEIRMVNVCHPWKNYSAFSYTAAGVVSQDWFAETLCEMEKESAEKLGIAGYLITKSKAMSVPTGSGGLFYLPYLWGGGGPHWNPNAKGAFIGLTFMHTKSHMARAVYEGVAMNFRWLMDQAKSAGVPIIEKDGIRAIGGGAKNTEWLQIYADVLGMKIDALYAPHEATSRGAFLAAGVGLKWFKDYTDAVEKAVRIELTLEPNDSNHGVYDELYPVFKTIYEALSPTFTDIARVQEKLLKS